MSEVKVPEGLKAGSYFEDMDKTCLLVREGEKNIPPVFTEVANFTARITHKIFDDDKGVSWRLELIGKTEEVVEVRSSEIVNIFRFRDRIGNKGLFLYNHTDTISHNKFIEYLHSKSTFSTVGKTRYLGRIDKKTFLFCNCLATPRGIKETDDVLIPPKGRLLFRKSNLGMAEVIKTFVDIYGDQAWKALGFAVGSLFVDELEEYFGFYPVLFLYGRKGSGKNTLAEFLRAFFGAHREIRPFNFNSTEKSKQRAGVRYKGIPITVNEYQNNRKNNMIISSFYDREGYYRAKRDDSLEIQGGEINSTLIVLGTQSISGIEAEAVLSRLVEIDLDEVSRKKTEIDQFRRLRDELAIFVEHCMKSLKPEAVLDFVREAIDCNLKIEADIRIIENYSILQGSANLLFSSLGLEKFLVRDIEDEVIKRDAETRSANAVEHFLNLLEILIANGSKNILNWATLNATTGELSFSLEHAYPLVGEEARKSGTEIPDQKTIRNQLKSMGAERRTITISKNKVKAWVLRRGQEPKGADGNHGVDKFLSLLERAIQDGHDGVHHWAKILPPSKKSPGELIFNIENVYPIILKGADQEGLAIPTPAVIRKAIKSMGAISKAVSMPQKVIKAWVMEWDGK